VKVSEKENLQREPETGKKDSATAPGERTQKNARDGVRGVGTELMEPLLRKARRLNGASPGEVKALGGLLGSSGRESGDHKAERSADKERIMGKRGGTLSEKTQEFSGFRPIEV